MPIPTTILATLAAACLLADCTTPPLVLDDSHPASVQAPEASTQPARSALRADANTLRTRELLAQRERQANAAESETPVDQTNPSPAAPRTAPGPMNGMKGMEGHENH